MLIIQEAFPPRAKPTSQAPSSPSSPSQSSQNKENAPPTTSSSSALPAPLLALRKSILDTLTTLFAKHPPHTIQRLAELLLTPTQHYRSLPSYLHALDRVVHVTSGAHTFPLPPAIPDPSALSLLSNGSVKPGTDPLSVSWGNPTATVAPALGSDESLGGALLTPITWLTRSGSGTHSPLEGEVKTESTEIVEGPNGPGGVETVSVSVNGVSSTTNSATHPGPSSGVGVVKESEIAALRAEGGITQGELLRQEQIEGVVPATQLSGRAGVDGLGEEDELPHARGPEEIGMDDTGPQASTQSIGGKGILVIDVEAAVGRKRDSVSPSAEAGRDQRQNQGTAGREPGTPKREASEVAGGEEKKAKTETAREAVLVDADGQPADEAKAAGEKGESTGVDAVDGTAV
ncbi:hypothetical protein BUE80_DR012797 [Diplocarpon rosae]|nr:hypothetical protein BUE80_DR012797 [Diplocarpon rosae]